MMNRVKVTRQTGETRMRCDGVGSVPYAARAWRFKGCSCLLAGFDEVDVPTWG